MNNKQKTNWWIDLTLLMSFLTAFFLDLTGLIAHQWIGMVSFALAAIHLLLHRNWVKSLLKRIFQRPSGRSSLYFVLDGMILFGFASIVFTGLMMSTWLNLALPNYEAWRLLHIITSIASLVLVLAKLMLHQGWIQRTTQKILAGPVMAPAESVIAQAATADANRTGRREFLVTMGVVSAASFFAVASASKSLLESIDATKVAESGVTPSPTIESAEGAEQSSETAEATAQATETTEITTQPTESLETPTLTPTQTATQADPTSTVSSEADCTVRCRKGCSYPGHCHRYVDSNNNNLCDLGECL